MTPKSFSQGIEKVLALAALDAKFCEKLLSSRVATLDECEIELTDSERSILMSIPDEQLKDAIKRTRVPDKARRAFLRGATVAVVTTLAVAAFGAVVIVPSILTAGCVSNGSAAAIAFMRTISSTQEQYRARFGTYGTLKELGDSNMIDSALASGKKSRHTFTISNVTETTWEARAFPETKGLRSFYIDQTCIMRWSKTKDVGPDSKALD